MKTLFESENSIEKYPYLSPIKEAIEAENAYGTDTASQKKLQKIFTQYFGQSWFALFEVHDAPKLADPVINSVQIEQINT